MSELLKVQFDAVAQSYDLQRRPLIPCFDDFYNTATAWINVNKKCPRVLDIGAGTGLFSACVRQKYPEAQLTLIDISEEMLKGARMRFGENHNVQYISGDFATYPFDGHSYDAVISSLAIHHLSHEDKSRLFHTIHPLLTEGGLFVNADQVAGTSAYFDNLYKKQWEDTVNLSGLSNEVIASAIERRKLDRNATIVDQLKWLSDAGFAEAECIYKYNEFAVFFAQK